MTPLPTDTIVSSSVEKAGGGDCDKEDDSGEDDNLVKILFERERD